MHFRGSVAIGRRSGNLERLVPGRTEWPSTSQTHTSAERLPKPVSKRRLRGEECVRKDSGLDPATAIDIRRAVSSLPRRQRTALILRYYLDMSVRDVAEAMDCPEETVKTPTSKSIASLGQSLPLLELKEVRDAY